MKNETLRKLRFFDLGLRDYREVLSLQENVRVKVSGQSIGPTVFFVEHPSVLTLGKNAVSDHIKLNADELSSRGISVHESDRGGQVTAHEPGQLVMYPILPIRDFNLTPKKYVSILEAAVISTLQHFGLGSAVDPKHPGIWIDQEKICAIGVRIKDRVTMHGIALNVSNSMETFAHIVPCGIADRGTTSLAVQLESVPSLSHVKEILAEQLCKLLGTEAIRMKVSDHLQTGELAFTIEAENSSEVLGV